MEALPMGYLVLSRKEGEQIRLTIDPGVDTEKLLRRLLIDGITIGINELSGRQARISIEAPPEVVILRTELIVD
jgi:sRNA-binding carbon storage regulator CsrA